MACKYYLNGKWITEAEFKAHLLGGGLENAINKGVEIEGYPKMEAKDGVSENYPISELTPEEEATEEERYNKELDEFDSFLKQQAPDLELTREQLDELNGSFYVDEDGTIRNYDGDETTIEAVIEKGKELKEGTIGESDDGKIRFVKEGDRIVMRDAQGNEILPQTRSSEVVTIKNYDRLLKDWKESGRKKGAPEIGKKYFSKREADEGVRLVDLKTYKKYESQLQKLDAVKGEPINSQDPREIADKSNDPRQIKDAYEDEKARLREIESTTSGVGGSKKDIIYELIKGGISEGDARILDLDNRDGSISVLGWKIYDTGKGDIDTVIDAFNEEFNADLTLKDIKDFIDEYNGGPHQYKAEREQTLRDLEDRYKELTGYSINTKEAAKVESKTKSEPKVETKKVEEYEKRRIQSEQPESTRNGGGREKRRIIAPLKDSPNVQGATGPDPNLVSVAEEYARQNGIDLKRQSEYAEIDVDRAERIAKEYEDMKHDPQNQIVKDSYADLIRQTKNQYQALVDAGYVFTFFDNETDPYQGNPWNAMRDLRNNKRMAVFGTYAGFGTEEITKTEIENNPMLADTDLRWKDQNGIDRIVTANDLFRAVHDAFGHGLEGAGFRARGEENAWQAHVRLYTGLAVGAITTETRGQNSWLNFGPYGEKNRTAKVEDTIFADQKTGLMPKWTWTEGRVKDMEIATEEAKVSVSEKEKIAPEQIKKEVEEKKVSEAFNKAADNIRKLKNKPRKITIKDENGNDIEVDLTTNDFWNAMIEIAAVAIEKTGKVADGVKAAIDYLKQQDFYKKLSSDQQKQVEDQIKNEIKDASGKKFKKKEPKKKESKFKKTVEESTVISEELKEKAKESNIYEYSVRTVKETALNANKAWDEIKNRNKDIEAAINEAEALIYDLNWEADPIERGSLAGIVAKELDSLRSKEGVSIEQINKYDQRAVDLLLSIRRTMTVAGQTGAVLGKFFKNFYLSYPNGINHFVQTTIDEINDKTIGSPTLEVVKTIKDMINDLSKTEEGIVAMRDYFENTGVTFGDLKKAKKKYYKTKKEVVVDEWDAKIKAYESQIKGIGPTAVSIPGLPQVVITGMKALKQAALLSYNIAQAVDLAMVEIKKVMGNDKFDEAHTKAWLKQEYEETQKNIEAAWQEKKDNEVKRKEAQFDKLFIEVAPKEKVERQTKQQRINKLAEELDSINGTTKYSEMAQEYAEKKESEKKSIINKKNKEAKLKRKENIEAQNELINNSPADIVEKMINEEVAKRKERAEKAKDALAEGGDQSTLSKLAKEKLRAEKELQDFESTIKNLKGIKLSKFVYKLAFEKINGKDVFTDQDVKRAYQQVLGGRQLSPREQAIIYKNTKIIKDGWKSDSLLKNGKISQSKWFEAQYKQSQATSRIQEVLSERGWYDLISSTLAAGFLGPKTLLANVASNLIWKPYTAIWEDTIFSFTDIFVSPGDARLLKERAAALVNPTKTKEYLKAVPTGLKLAAKQFIEGVPQANKLGDFNNAYQMRPIEAWQRIRDDWTKNKLFLDKMNDISKDLFEGSFGIIHTIILRALSGGDVTSRVPESAKQNAKISAERLKIPLETYLLDEAYEGYREVSEKISERLTFQNENPLTAVLGKMTPPKNERIAKIRKWFLAGLVKPIFPYINTPVNVKYEMLTMIPIFALPEFHYRYKNANDPNLSSEDRLYNNLLAQKLMRRIVGSIPLYLAASTLLAAKIFEFVDSDDDELKDAKIRSNKQYFEGPPIRAKFNKGPFKGQSIDIIKLGPIFDFLYIVDQTNKAYAEEDGSATDKISAAMEQFLRKNLKSTIEQTFFTGLNNLVKAINADNERDVRRLLIDTYGQAAVNVILPATFNYVTKWQDTEHLLRLTKDKDFITEFWNKTVRQRLGWIKNENFNSQELPPLYNVAGKPISTNETGQLDVIHFMFDFTRSEAADPNKRPNVYVFRKYEETKNGDWLMPIAPRTFNYEYINPKSKNIVKLDVKLDPILQNEYQRILGTLVTKGLTELFKLNENPKLSAIQTVYETAGVEAKKKFYEEFKDKLEPNRVTFNTKIKD